MVYSLLFTFLIKFTTKVPYGHVGFGTPTKPLYKQVSLLLGFKNNKSIIFAPPNYLPSSFVPNTKVLP